MLTVESSSIILVLDNGCLVKSLPLRVWDEALGDNLSGSFATMSCSEKNIAEGGGNERPFVARYSIEGASQNGFITASSELSVDERVLVDPRRLFIGSKIGEGAHGKVYEGR